MTSEVSGVITALDMERRVGKLRVPGQANRIKLYWGPDLSRRVRGCFGSAVTLSGQWVDETFDVWRIGK
jgi:hypothetical protein